MEGQPRKFFLCCILGLGLIVTGCAGQQTGKQPEVPKGNETERIESGNNDGDSGQGQEYGQEPEKEPPLPVSITVIDPQTKAAIHSINPAELGYGKDDQAYTEYLESWAYGLARGADGEAGYDQRNTPDKLGDGGQIIKGKPRVVLEEEELVKRIMAASKTGGTVELPLTVTASGYLAEEAASLGEVVIASYKTYFNSKVAGRTQNIVLSAKAIDNVIVGVDDYFSFNTTVGPSDEEHGYQPAEEAVNGKLVMGIGGGICQTSSTLYNAVDKIGISYVEKHHHSVTVGYVPKGRDATVSYGGKDFRFQNTSGVPFLIKAIVGNGELIVEVRTSKQYQELMKKSV